METWHRCWACAAGLLGLAPAGAQPAPELQLPSCVVGSPPLTLAAGTALARLDSGDRSRFHDAAQVRYPLYQRGGFAPSEVLMLQRGRHWQYVAVAPLGTKGWCLVAVFAADRFDFTERWLTKYQPRAAAADD